MGELVERILVWHFAGELHIAAAERFARMQFVGVDLVAVRKGELVGRMIVVRCIVGVVRIAEEVLRMEEREIRIAVVGELAYPPCVPFLFGAWLASYARLLELPCVFFVFFCSSY